MNSNFHKLVLIFFVFAIATASARKMASGKGEVDQRINGEESHFKIASVDSFDKVMGVEECGNGDKECLMRKATLEAHLDYIYTQSRIP